MPNPVIRSQTVSIGDLLRLGMFQPARVQRDYCWTADQQAGLLNDLVASFGEFGLDPEVEPDTAISDAMDGSDASGKTMDLPDRDLELELTSPFCFVGTIVLHPGGERFDIYDGLQRLTTFTVVFAVIRDLMETEKDHPIHRLLSNESGIWRLNLQMKHNTLESDILAVGRTAKRHRPHPQLTDASERLRECVATARSLFQGWSHERLAAFAAFLSEAVLVTVTRISDRRIAAKAFVSINSGGVPLKPEEIVKGQLIDLSTALPDADDAARRILFVWKSVQDDLGKERFDDFLRSVDFIERRAPQSADYAIQLMEHIRRRYPGQLGFRWATDLLLQYRSAFNWIHEAANEDVAVGVHASLRRLQLLKWDQWRAYAMLIKMKSKPQDLDHRIDVLDRACFALSLATPDARRCAEMVGRRVEKFARGTFGKQGGFTFSKAQHERMVRALNSPLDAGRRGGIMRWIEAAAHEYRVPRYIVDPRSSVEHVYPKNPQDNWSEFEQDLEINQLATLREMTGNLCVLTQDELGNTGFDDKRRAYSRFKICRFAGEIARARTWSPDVIRARTAKLTDTVLKFLDIEVAGA